MAEATGALGCYRNSSVQQVEVASMFQIHTARAIFSIAVALALGVLGTGVAFVMMTILVGGGRRLGRRAPRRGRLGVRHWRSAGVRGVDLDRDID